MVVHMDRMFFFDAVREELFKGELTQPQVEGITAILDAWKRRFAPADRRWLAYILATAYHETAYTMQPVRETLAESDVPALLGKDALLAAGRGWLLLVGPWSGAAHP